jgi:hypothetical protein
MPDLQYLPGIGTGIPPGKRKSDARFIDVTEGEVTEGDIVESECISLLFGGTGR